MFFVLLLTNFLDFLLGLYEFCIVAYSVVLLLLNMGVLNDFNYVVRFVFRFLFVVVDPFLSFLRMRLPVVIAGVDFSALLAVLCIVFVRSVVIPWIVYSLS